VSSWGMGAAKAPEKMAERATILAKCILTVGGIDWLLKVIECVGS
jgi:hypothetical protein